MLTNSNVPVVKEWKLIIFKLHFLGKLSLVKVFKESTTTDNSQMFPNVMSNMYIVLIILVDIKDRYCEKRADYF